MLMPPKRHSTSQSKRAELRLAHPIAYEPAHNVPRSAAFSWLDTPTAIRREQTAEGMVLGCAVAEALSLPRNGLSRRKGIRLYGRELTFQFVPGHAVPGERTHALFATLQAMFRSRANFEEFGDQLSFRLAWYQRSSPFRYLKRIFGRMARSHDSTPMSIGLGDDPLIRAVAVSLMIQGSQSAQPWIEASTAVTHREERVAHASMLVACAAQIASLSPPNNGFNPAQALETLVGLVEETHLSELLMRLEPLLKRRAGISVAARDLGWKDGIPSDVYAIAVMGIYAWLRHYDRFRFAVERSALLGGECSGVATLAGALCGIHLERRGIPPSWIQALTLFPYDRAWRIALVNRIKDWPHGVEDIQSAHSQPSILAGQCLRSALLGLFRTIHKTMALPSAFLDKKTT
jgi:ADP-ribosyl-[dinitrogen reductase] hydrolase